MSEFGQSRRFAVMQEMSAIGGDSDSGNLRNDGRLILHIIPLTALSQENVIDLKRLDPSELFPIWCSGCNCGYTAKYSPYTVVFGSQVPVPPALIGTVPRLSMANQPAT